MRVSRLILENFRGWAVLDLRPAGHVLLAGVPRAGRSDIVTALSRALDPESIRMQPDLADLSRRLEVLSDDLDAGEDIGSSDTPAPEMDVTDSLARSDSNLVAEYSEVEVTLVDLDAELEQEFDGYLEPQDSAGQADPESAMNVHSKFCVRIAYRVVYDALTDSLEHFVYFPARSNPKTKQYQRVPIALRRLLPVAIIGSSKPLQLRPEGTLRKLLMDRDPAGAADALGRLRDSVNEATAGLSAEPTVMRVVDMVLSSGGVSQRLSEQKIHAGHVSFQAEDGSQAALLRAMQPALHLDDAGVLPISSHGSTTAAILSSAEALLVAQRPGAIVLTDDFGDQLDSATAEHSAAMLRADAGQLWMSSRRSEVARAFEPYELIRLTRHAGVRAIHVIERPTDRKELAVERILHSQLLPALTSSTVVITEGPHDIGVYALADRRRTPSFLPLSSYGVRIVTADNGSGGGTGQIARVARLAKQMGFRVIGLIDGETKWDGAILTEIELTCDVLVRLPDGVAIERAIVMGVNASELRAAATTLAEWGVPDPTIGVSDGEVAESLIRPVHNHGLHQPLLEALIPNVGVPPLISAALDALIRAADPSCGESKIALNLSIESPVSPIEQT